uniref:hypothetical protein n=1 Tax=Orrella sp. TaxID=1921583 RepID=UPI004055785C
MDKPGLTTAAREFRKEVTSGRRGAAVSAFGAIRQVKQACTALVFDTLGHSVNHPNEIAKKLRVSILNKASHPISVCRLRRQSRVSNSRAR